MALFSVVAQYDIKNRRTFLKRTDYPSITPDHLFIGAEITVWSRNLKVVEYSDAFTKDKLAERSEKSVMQVPIGALPGAMAAVASAGLRVNKLKTIAQGGEKTVVMEVVAAGAVSPFRRRRPRGAAPGGRHRAHRTTRWFRRPS